MPHKAKLMLISVLVTGAAAILCAQPASPDPNARPPKPTAGVDQPAAPPAVTEQQAAELLRALEARRSKVAEELKRLKEESPREYRFALASAWKDYQNWKDLPPEIQQAHENRARARLDAWRASRDYLAATDAAKKDQLRSRIQDLLGQEFDAEQTIREFRLNQLEDQIKRLRSELKDRSDRRSQVIDQAVTDLLAAKGPRPKADGELRRPPGAGPHSMPAGTTPPPTE